MIDIREDFSIYIDGVKIDGVRAFVSALRREDCNRPVFEALHRVVPSVQLEIRKDMDMKYLLKTLRSLAGSFDPPAVSVVDDINVCFKGFKKTSRPEYTQMPVFLGGVVGPALIQGEWVWVTKYYQRNFSKSTDSSPARGFGMTTQRYHRRLAHARGRHWDRKRRD